MTRERALIGAAAGLYGAAALGALAWGLARQSTVAAAGALLLCAVPVLLFLLGRAPAAVAAVPGVVLGFMSFAAVPGTGFQLVLPLALLLVPLAVVHPCRRRPALGTLGAIMLAYLAVSGVSAVATLTGADSLFEYAKWAVASGTMLLALLIRDDLRTVLGRAYVAGAVAGVVLSVGMLAVDRTGGWVERFGVFGYGNSVAGNARTAVVDGAEVLRAAGLYVDPNSAGLFFLLAMGVAATVLTGRWRAACLAVLALGVFATLSRAAILSLIVAAVVAVCCARIDAGRRLLAVAAGTGALAAALLVPAVSSRLVGSFDRSDVGASARLDALAAYPGHLAGSWWFGRGWYLREFYDASFGYALNHVANTPLIVVYRAGLFSGAVFLVLLVVAVVFAIRAGRVRGGGAAVAAGVLAGLALVAFQLDFPVVTMPPLAMAFALLLAQVQATAADRPPDPGTAPPRDRPDAAHDVGPGAPAPPHHPAVETPRRS